jgi:hypothetical protein
MSYIVDSIESGEAKKYAGAIWMNAGIAPRKKDLKFILTVNVIGLAGILSLALFANDPVLQKVYIIGTVISACGFILSCIDYAKEEKS